MDTIATSFKMLDVPREKKVIFGTYLLREYTKDWWKSKKTIKFPSATMITWEDFCHEFEIEFEGPNKWIKSTNNNTPSLVGRQGVGVCPKCEVIGHFIKDFPDVLQTMSIGG